MPCMSWYRSDLYQCRGVISQMTLGVALKTHIERLNPAIGYPTKNATIGDLFQRESLTPTGYPTIYTEAVTGLGSGAMNANGTYILTTGAVTGDDVDLRMSGLALARQSSRTFGSVRTITGTLDYYTIFNLQSAVNHEGFVGLMGNSFSALTAIPTTAVHMGVYWDISAQANFRITSANGTSQVDDDSGIPLDTTARCLHIRWTGLNTATIELLDVTNFLPIAATTFSVSALNSLTQMYPHWFVQTETTAARAMATVGWMAKIT